MNLFCVQVFSGCKPLLDKTLGVLVEGLIDTLLSIFHENESKELRSLDANGFCQLMLEVCVFWLLFFPVAMHSSCTHCDIHNLQIYSSDSGKALAQLTIDITIYSLYPLDWNTFYFSQVNFATFLFWVCPTTFLFLFLSTHFSHFFVPLFFSTQFNCPHYFLNMRVLSICCNLLVTKGVLHRSNRSRCRLLTAKQCLLTRLGMKLFYIYQST